MWESCSYIKSRTYLGNMLNSFFYLNYRTKFNGGEFKHHYSDEEIDMENINIIGRFFLFY